MTAIVVSSEGVLFCGDKSYRCAIGAGGMREGKHEGDKATPLCCMSIRKVLYRPDRLSHPPTTVFPVEPIRPNDGWCDDPTHAAYNTRVSLPFEGSHEVLWRDDHVYDIVVVLGYNDAPSVPGRGSAIFMHIAREGYPPTEGCIALAKDDLLEVLAAADPQAAVCTFI